MSKWIIKKDACGRNYTVCPNCNTSIEWRDRRGVLLKVDMETANFCPNCGADMREPDTPCGGCNREDKENCSYCPKMERREE